MVYDGQMKSARELPCQDCGDPVMTLTEAQQQAVAERPYDFIMLCGRCKASFSEEMDTRREEAYAVHEAPTAITSFKGQYRFLSNFYDVPYTAGGVTYPTNEHYFAAAKTNDPAAKARIVAAKSGREARTLGQSRSFELVENWDTEGRYAAMRSGLEHKFAPGTRERELLLGTGDALLVEDTTGWHDQFWGDCSCPRHLGTPGANWLGRMLMELRAEIRGDAAKHWPRAMVTGHRPGDFDDDTAEWVRQTLTSTLLRLTRKHGTTVAIGGLALGVDTWWAQAALAHGVELWGYVPFEDQAVKWPDAEQAMWRDLRSACTREIVLGTEYDVRLLHARNYYMIRDSCVVVAVLDPSKTSGGTFNAVKKARAVGWPIIMIDPVARTVGLES